MNTWTLVIMVSLGYEFQKNPLSVNSTVVEGFTTEQACLNAKNTIQVDNLRFNWTEMCTKRCIEMRANYWSSSKFSNWLRKKFGLENPKWHTLEGWDIHEEECKKKAPIIHWITNKGFKVTRYLLLPC